MFRNSNFTSHTTADLVQLEEDRQQAEGPSEEERLKMAVADAVRGKAATARMEAMDEAKRMNQMVLYSKCMAVRCGSSVPARACETALLYLQHIRPQLVGTNMNTEHCAHG